MKMPVVLPTGSWKVPVVEVIRIKCDSFILISINLA